MVNKTVPYGLKVSFYLEQVSDEKCPCETK